MLSDQSRSTRLRELFPGADYFPAGSDPVFTGVTADPGAVTPGDLFVHLDDFDSADAEQAAARGASVIVTERLLPIGPIAQAVVEDSRVALRALEHSASAAAPELQQHVVVGALGSERAATWLAAILATLEQRVGLLTETCEDDGEHCVARPPGDRVAAGRWRRRCDLGGVTAAVLQATPDCPAGGPSPLVCVTSLRCDGLTADGRRRWHAVSSHRAALRECGGLTNHRGLLVYNADDPDAARLAAEHPGRSFGFGESDAADLVIEPLEGAVGGQSFLASVEGDSACVRLPVAGRAARRDAAAAIASVVASGARLHEAAAGLDLCAASPSQLRPVFAGQDFAVQLDSALRPLELADALEAAEVARGVAIAVVRLAHDPSVRREQIMTASRMAGRVFAHGDAGVNLEAPENVTVVEDRLAAIAIAIGLAEMGDVVLLAGSTDETDRRAADGFIRRRLACEDKRAAA